MSDSEEEKLSEIKLEQSNVKQSAKKQTKQKMTAEEKEKRLEILAKARAKASEKRQAMREAGYLTQKELRAKQKQELEEARLNALRKKAQNLSLHKEDAEEDEVGSCPHTTKGVPTAKTQQKKDEARGMRGVPAEEEDMSNNETDTEVEVVKKPKAKAKPKKKKKIVYVESDSDSESEEEIVYKKRRSNRKQPKWSAEDIEELKQREIEARLAKRNELDELQKLEDEAIKRKYKESLQKMRLETMRNFIAPECNFRRK